MKIKKIYVGLVVAATFLALCGSLFYVSRLGAPENKAVAFISIGLDQKVLPTEVSSYEILRATEHFSDIVLGWTVDPAFDIGYSFSGRRQEKQNLIFEVYGVKDTVPAEKLVGLIRDRLAAYDSVTNSGYLIALDTYTLVPGERNDSRTVAGATLLVFVFSILGVILWEYAARN